jgi:PAS domain-containing protein
LTHACFYYNSSSEAYAQQLKDNKESIPDAVKILLADARQRNEKLHAKRMSNRKFASASRARKNQVCAMICIRVEALSFEYSNSQTCSKSFLQLIAELSASNRMLRRGALVLSYIPDPVIALDLNGKIKFCSMQVNRVLQYRLDDLIGASIEHIVAPKSRETIRRLIRDLVTAEQLAAGGEGLDRGNDSGDSSNDTNVLSRRSDQSFPLLEVNVDDAQGIGSGENVSDSSSGGVPSKDGKQTKRHKDGSDKSNSRSTMSSLTQKSSSFFSETSAMKNNEKPLAKKNKPNENGSASTSNSKASGGIGMNIDDVMGSSVTANNAGAKLSSLIHYTKEEQEQEQGSDDNMKPPPERIQQKVQPYIHEKHRGPRATAAALAQKQDSGSSSSTESQREQRAGQNSSEDSGYRESNESSDSALDSSSMSGISSRAKSKYFFHPVSSLR